jgi:nitrate/TMAO reductase-like tetraheme cytochrome c subunit
MSEAVDSKKLPALFHNYVSFAGFAIAIASLCSIVLLFLIELTGNTNTAYLGIFAYVLLPSVLVFGLLVVGAGMLIERRRRRKLSPDEIAAFPKIDFNNPNSRRAFFSFIGLSMIFVFMSAFGSYRAFEHTESVAFCGTTCHETMKPEYVAFQVSSHARLRCVDCHVGSGAGWYARSKITGAYQLYAVAFNKVPKPITTPVHNMRPARDTCEQCHWPSKFYGNQLKNLTHYAYDEQNTARMIRLLVNVGGGDPATGPVAGIHWHMNLGNEITFIPSDEHRQVIPWVRVKDRQGNVTEYTDRNRPPTAEQMATTERRRMDCIDCHNRPAHTYLPPDVALDQAFAAGRLDPSIPYLKRKAVEVLSGSYETTPQALSSIDRDLSQFYQTNYKDVYAQKQEAIKGAVTEVQRIFQTYFFPEMKTDWQTHPNNIGHLYSSGCFRCHDGEHVSNTGKVISNNCNVCHTVIYDSAAPPEKNIRTGPFQHPVDLGALADHKCEYCHKANKPFQHPINLGDISMFQCVECHPKNDAKSAK